MRHLLCQSRKGSKLLLPLTPDLVANEDPGRPGETLVRVQGFLYVVKMSFDEFLRIYEADDSVATVDYQRWPDTLVWLARNKVGQVAKELGPENALRFYREAVSYDRHEGIERLYLRYKENLNVHRTGSEGDDRGGPAVPGADNR